MTIIDNVAPSKTKPVKGNIQNWFDGEVIKKLRSRDKLFTPNSTNVYKSSLSENMKFGQHYGYYLGSILEEYSILEGGKANLDV